MLKLKYIHSTWWIVGTVRVNGQTKRVRRNTQMKKNEKRIANALLLETIDEKTEQIRGNNHVSPKVVTQKVEDIVRLYLRRPDSPTGTDASFLVNHFMEKYKGRSVFDLRADEIISWLYGSGNSAGTIKRKITSINSCLNFARRAGIPMPEINLSKPVVNDERERWLTDEERDRLLAACDEELRPIITFLFFTGVRLGEAKMLTWQYVQEDCVLIASIKGNRRKFYRSVPLHARAKQAMGQRNDSNAFVFSEADGTVWGARLWKLFNEACERAGIEDFRPHDARHTFASRLMQEGAGIENVQALLGHRNLNMTMRYAHHAPSQLKGAVDLLGDDSKGE